MQKKEKKSQFFSYQKHIIFSKKKYTDNIPEKIKQRRLSEIIKKQQIHSRERNQAHLNKVFNLAKCEPEELLKSKD